MRRAHKPSFLVRNSAASDYWLLMAVCTVATAVVIVTEGFLLTFAWNEFDLLPRTANVAYLLLSVTSLISAYYFQHQESSTAGRIRIAVLANLFIIVLPPLFFLGLPNG